MVMGPTRDLGPCVMTWNSTDLGKTFGSVLFRYAEEDKGVFEDQMGTGSVDDILVGQPCEVEVPLTRMALSKLSALIAGASGSGTSGEGNMTVKLGVGKSRYDRAQELILKPVLENGAADPDTGTWLHIFKASPRPNFELTYNNEGQRVYKMVFKGYPDQSGTGALYRIWRIGPA